ncbi:hypothetical protein GGR51DRAFT_417470 [Nemania sp. FL0031]|nr:hypothetical protein GGR51DRAFT_417470 [Nemania sp. FL0031]
MCSNESLLEQLKNLLPIAKKEMGKLADHQRQHGLGYNSGMPDDIMLVVSKEIQRQVARAIKPYIEAETARDRFSGPRRRESRRDSSIIDEADFRRRWASPSRRSGSDAESIGDLPRRPANRVSFQNATNTTATPGHDGVVAKTIDTDESGVQPPNPPTDSADHTSERGSDKASSNESKRVEVTETAQDSHNPVEHKLEPRESWEHYSLDNSDPNQPRIHRCTYSHCSLCGGTHCGHKPCKVLEQTTLMEEKPPNDTPLGSSPPESKKSITGAASSREDATSPQGVLAQHSPALTVESEEQSGQSDKATGSPKNGSSRTSLASPSSKSSSPSTEGSRSPHAKDRDSRSAQVVTNEAQEMPDPSKGASGVSTTERQSQPESRPEPDLDDRRSVQGGQRKLEGRELWAKEEQRRRRRSRPVSYQSHVSDDSDTGSGNPSPYVPVPPFGGPGSRRRPRRPRPTQ